jgi:hypothetical protein
VARYVAVRRHLATFRRLVWRNEGGGKVRAPAAGSEVHALYVRLEASAWEDGAGE